MSTRFARTNGTTRFNALSIAKSPIPSLELDEEWNRLNTACNAIDDDLIAARGAKASVNQRFLDIEAEVTNARDGEANLLAKEDAQDALISAVQTEVANARGSTGALDTRLDVALNEDGTLKAGATQNTTEWSSAAFAGLARSSDTQLTVNGDQTTIFLVGRKVRSLSGSAYAYHEVVSSAYVTVTTVTVSGTALPSPLNDVDFGIITPVASGQSSLPDLNLNADMVDGVHGVPQEAVTVNLSGNQNVNGDGTTYALVPLVDTATRCFDQNGNWTNASTYKYTVPATGYYRVSYHNQQGVAGQDGVMRMKVYLNGAALNETQTSAHMGLSCGMSIILSLTLSSYIQLYAVYSDTVGNNLYAGLCTMSIERIK